MTEEVPVFIAGAGPTGLCASLLLSRHGVDSLTVERHPGTSIFPRATGINVRSMEVLRSLGLEESVRRAAFTVTPSIGRSKTLVDPDAEQSSLVRGEADAVSPCEWTSCSQRELEPILVAAAAEEPRGQIRFGTELLRFEQDGQGVTAQILDRATGTISEVRSRYLIAADGSKSRVRERLGISMLGPGELMPAVSIHFRADIRDRLPQAPNFIHVVAADGTFGIFIPTDNDRHWVFAVPKRFATSPAQSIDLIRLGSGVPDLKVEVLGVVSWTMQADCAERLRAGDVFLAGDAAHRMTPAGGLGMNTGIQDVHNLCWKLAAVLSGTASSDLLDTYERERKPVAQHNMQRSADLIAEPQNEEPALDVDLGFSYASAAVIPDGPSPTGRPGSRAPHAWLGAGSDRISTLDLFGPQWALLTGPRGEAWTRAAHGLAVPFRLRALDGTSADLYGLGRDGAVLVRPDGHVAWRQSEGAPCPSRALQRALDAVFGRDHNDRTFMEV